MRGGFIGIARLARTAAWLLVPAAVVCAWSIAAGSPTEPTAGWVYPYFRELRLRSPGSPFFVSTGPYERQDLATWLRGASEVGAPEGARAKWLRDMLDKEYAPEIASAERRSPVVAIVITPSWGLRTDGHARPEMLGDLTVYSPEGVSLWTSLRATANAPENHKVRTTPWHGPWRASFDHGGVGYRSGGLSIFLGRDEVSWGASRDRGLLLSGSAPSLDMVKFSFSRKSFCFTSIHSELRKSDLDQWAPDVRRFLSAHRLEYLPGRRWGFSLSEAVIYGGVGRDFNLGYLNPMAPFYAEQWNSRGDDNVLMDGDVSFLLPGRIDVRAEVVVDDFQLDFKTEPNEMGLGVDVAAINPLCPAGGLMGGSYFRVTNRTYGHRISWNRFVQEGMLLGYPEGPDGDRFEVWSSWSPRDDFTVRAGYDLTRQGEGRVTDAQDEPGRKQAFPSGTVETEHAVRADLGWRPAYQLLVSTGLQWSRQENYGNQRGHTRSGFDLAFRVTYNLRSIEK
jgi:hypothetical protein